MNRRERLERKLEKRREWAAARAKRATEKINGAVDMMKVVPLGQPILVGHHSERGHRRLIEKSDNKMRSGIEDHDMAQHHASKADGLESQLDSCIFSDDDDAVEQLEARIAELNAERERWKTYNASCRKGKQDLSLLDDRQRADMESVMRVTAYNVGKGGSCPAYKLQNLGANIRRLEQRLVQVKARATRQAAAEDAGGVLIQKSGDGEYCRITFSEKPERSIINALKTAGFRWGNGAWSGSTKNIPECVNELV